MRIGITIGLFFGLISVSTAQNDSTQAVGQVISGQVVIQKAKEVKLLKANKVYLPALVPDSIVQAIPIRFDISMGNVDVPVQMQTIVPSSPKSIYSSQKQNWIKGGFGNYSSPLLHLGIYQEVSNWSLGSEAFYERFGGGPVGESNSSSSEGSIKLKGSRDFENWNLTPTISFKRLGYGFYGNTVREDGLFPVNASRGSATFFEIGSSIGNRKQKWEYALVPAFSIARSGGEGRDLLNRTTVAKVDASALIRLNQGQTSGVSLRLQNSQYEGGLSYGRSLMKVSPWFGIDKTSFKLRLGVSLVSATFDGSSNTGLYPDINALYNVAEQWEVLGSVSGGQQLVGLDSILLENQFIDDSTTLGVLEDQWKASLGIRGLLAPKLTLEAEVGYRETQGLPFFVFAAADSSKYEIAYDQGQVGIFSMRGKLTYEPGAFTRTGISGEFFSYSLSSLERPWHQPKWMIKPYVSHNVSRKILISAAGTLMGGIDAPNSDFERVRLPAFADVSLGVKYLFNKEISAFIEIDNLLGGEYQRFLGYPARGITFKIGGQYRF